MPAHTCKKSTGVRMKLQPCFYHLQVFASMMLPATMDVAQVCLAAWKSAACVRISFIMDFSGDMLVPRRVLTIIY